MLYSVGIEGIYLSIFCESHKRHHAKGIKSTDVKIGERVLLHQYQKDNKKGGGGLSKNWVGLLLLKTFLRRELIDWKDFKMQQTEVDYNCM